MSSRGTSDRLAVAVAVPSLVFVSALPAAAMIGATALLLDHTEAPVWLLLVAMPVVYLVVTWGSLRGMFWLLDRNRRPLSDGDAQAAHPPPRPPGP